MDHYSSYGYIHFQKSSSVQETLQAKKTFEQISSNHGVTIKRYHADNGVFRANKWVEDCQNKNQNLTFAGVNAHHQNGRAEHRIRMLQELTRTQMIQAAHKWRSLHVPPLWPYAMRIANHALNNTPNMQNPKRLSPIQLFSSSVINNNPLKDSFPFASPVYVLRKELQQNKPFHKWKDRAKLGAYLGPSPNHARSIALVLDLHTGLVSPQFHVAHDSSYETVKDDKSSHQWSQKAGFRHVINISNDMQKFDNKSSNKDTIDSDLRLMNDDSKAKPSNCSSKRHYSTSMEKSSSAMSKRQKLINYSSRHVTSNGPTPGLATLKVPKPNMQHKMKPRRSDRKKTPIERLTYVHETEIKENEQIIGEIFKINIQNDNLTHPNYPLLAIKATTDPDTLYFHEAVKQKDRKQFLLAMEEEINSNITDNTFTLTHISEIPQDATILPSVWALRRKRDLKTQQIKRWKARLNVDGSKMIKGVHYDTTYAPVASWAVIRLFLIIAVTNKWYTKQIDYKMAFPQAPIERPLYMKIPAGYHISNGNKQEYVLKLNKNLYGQKQAGRVWNKYLVEKLTHYSVGLTQSKINECIFYKKDIIYILYTDDSIIMGPNIEEITTTVKALRKLGLNLTEEGDIQDFLGVNITHRQDGKIEFNQSHLIEQIIQDMKMPDNTNPRDTPALASKILHRHPSSKPFDRSFNYRSIIGKLAYLEKGSRPEIAYIVHQCARYAIDPKEEHGKAIRWIIKYLLGTRTKGTIMTPNRRKGLEVYVDADYAGNWNKMESYDPDTARSRHGYVIMYEGCPVVCKSQLQTEITLSSTEAEYTGLSYALREAIPLINLLKEISNIFTFNKQNTVVKCRVFEDNIGALEIATNHKYRPRTKHLNIRLHHFRSYVQDGTISISKIDTNDQIADIFTKPLTTPKFIKLRKQIIGW